MSTFLRGVCVLAANTYGEEPPSASTTVSVTIDSILAVLTDEHTGPKEQQQKTLAEIKRTFDFGDVSRRVLAHYESQTAEIVEERMRNANSARVMTLIESQEKTIPVDYSLKLRDGRWLAYDVIINGVSLSQNYRNSYQQLVADTALKDYSTE